MYIYIYIYTQNIQYVLYPLCLGSSWTALRVCIRCTLWMGVYPDHVWSLKQSK